MKELLDALLEEWSQDRDKFISDRREAEADVCIEQLEMVIGECDESL